MGTQVRVPYRASRLTAISRIHNLTPFGLLFHHFANCCWLGDISQHSFGCNTSTHHVRWDYKFGKMDFKSFCRFWLQMSLHWLTWWSACLEWMHSFATWFWCWWVTVLMCLVFTISFTVTRSSSESDTTSSFLSSFVVAAAESFETTEVLLEVLKRQKWMKGGDIN